MSTRYDSRNRRWRYEFDQVIQGQRIRRSQLLPAAWSGTQAKAFSQKEDARLYAIATGVAKERRLIQDAVDAYVDHRCPELKGGYEAMQELLLIEPFYRDCYLDELADVGRAYADEERERLAPATIRNRLAYLRAACRYAQKHHGVGDKEMRLVVATPQVRNERQVYATRTEMLRIARKCAGTPAQRDARALIRLAFYSGMRLGEFMDLAEKNEVVADGFLLRDTKNGSDRIAPMHPKARVLLKYLPFTYGRDWLQKLIRRAMNAAGFKHLTLHDLRHSTASALINNGVDLYTVGAILGHKDARSTKRYAHLATRTLNAAILKVK